MITCKEISLVWVAGGQYGLVTKAVYKTSTHKSQTNKGVDTSRIKTVT
jgi:hypothetical protein